MARGFSDWGVIAEIVSAIEVVLSLIFVGLQTRDNTLATEAAMYQDSVAYDLGNLRVFGALNAGANQRTFGGAFFEYAMSLRADAAGNRNLRRICQSTHLSCRD